MYSELIYTMKTKFCVKNSSIKYYNCGQKNRKDNFFYNNHKMSKTNHNYIEKK